MLYIIILLYYYLEDVFIRLIATRQIQNIDVYNTELFLFKPWKIKGFFQFEIIIIVLVTS